MLHNRRMLSEEELAEILAPERLKLPKSPKVIGVKVEDYEDWTGDEALDVYVLLDPRTTDRQRSWRYLERINDEVVRAIRSSGETRFPYVTFGTPEEYQNRYTP